MDLIMGDNSVENGSELSLLDYQKSTPIVVDCPVCKRVIWAGARCYHGKPPLAVKCMGVDYQKEEEEVKPSKRRKKDKYGDDC